MATERGQAYQQQESPQGYIPASLRWKVASEKAAGFGGLRERTPFTYLVSISHVKIFKRFKLL